MPPHEALQVDRVEPAEDRRPRPRGRGGRGRLGRLLSRSLRRTAPGRRTVGAAGDYLWRPPLRHQRRCRRLPDSLGCSLVKLGNGGGWCRKAHFLREGDRRCVARRTQGARELTFGGPGRLLQWGRCGGPLARHLGPRDVWRAGDRADWPQRAGNKPRSRASEYDGKPDVKRHPAAEERGNAAHVGVP